MAGAQAAALVDQRLLLQDPPSLVHQPKKAVVRMRVPSADMPYLSEREQVFADLLLATLFAAVLCGGLVLEPLCTVSSSCQCDAAACLISACAEGSRCVHHHRPRVPTSVMALHLRVLPLCVCVCVSPPPPHRYLLAHVLQASHLRLLLPPNKNPIF